MTHLHNQDSLPLSGTEESSSLPAPLPPGQSTAFSVHQRRATQALRRKQIVSSLRNPLFCFHVSQEEARRPKKEADDLRLLTHPPKSGARETSSGASCSSQASPLTPPPPPSQPPSGTFRGFPESCRTRRRFLDLSLASTSHTQPETESWGWCELWLLLRDAGQTQELSKPELVWPEGMDAAASSVWHPGELGWLSLAETHSGWEGGLLPGSQSPGRLTGWRGVISRWCCWSKAMTWLLGCSERTPEEAECARCCPLHGHFCLHHLPHLLCTGLWPLRTTSAGRLWAPQLPWNPSGRSEDGETELTPSKSTKRDTS